MTKSERAELSEIKQILDGAFKDKYDPENGWKTARAVFERETVLALNGIHEKLTDLKKIPDLVTSVNDIQCWRKRFNKVMIYIGTGVIIPLILFIIYQEIK